MVIRIVGVSGGLGNQMFQYAFFLSLKNASQTKDITEFYIAPYDKHNGYELSRVFGIKQNIVKNSFIGFVKKFFKESILIIKELNSECNINNYVLNNHTAIYYSGYWQNEMYFKDIRNNIRRRFTFSTQNINEKSKELYDLIQQKNSVCIHIRRGDYENDARIKAIHGGVCTIKYYIEAITYIKERSYDPFFYIFTDEPKWVKMNFPTFKNSCIVDCNKNNESWQDMFLMSQCKHNIIANSSFSWWGAWLNSNQNKIVIAPKKWFNTKESSQIVPQSWIQI